jgi:cytoskeletal protein RodZ
MDFDDPDDNRYAAEVGRLPWYKRTALIVSVVSAAVALLLLGVVLALTLDHPETTPVNPPSRSTPAPAPSEQTVTVTDTPTTTAPPPPSATTEAPVTTTAPPVTTTEAPVTTTTVPPVTTTVPPPTEPSPTRDRPRLFPLFPRWR